MLCQTNLFLSQETRSKERIFSSQTNDNKRFYSLSIPLNTHFHYSSLSQVIYRRKEKKTEKETMHFRFLRCLFFKETWRTEQQRNIVNYTHFAGDGVDRDLKSYPDMFGLMFSY